MSPCDRIRHHLSALADGELRPLEAIAIRRHVARCDSCRAEVDGVEGLKLQVHVAGTEVAPSRAQLARWRGAVEARAEASRALRLRRNRLIPAAAAAAVAAFTALAWSVLGPLAGDPAATSAAARGHLDREAMGRMVDVHRGEAGPSHLDDLVQAGALLTFQSLPGGFIPPEGERGRVVPASFVERDESTVGASLAVLRSAELELPDHVLAGLRTGGVYVEVVDGVEVRVSRSGDEVFVLLSELHPDGRGGSI